MNGSAAEWDRFIAARMFASDLPFRFTKDGEFYSVFDSVWSGTWVIGEYGVAYRTLSSAGTGAIK